MNRGTVILVCLPFLLLISFSILVAIVNVETGDFNENWSIGSEHSKYKAFAFHVESTSQANFVIQNIVEAVAISLNETKKAIQDENPELAVSLSLLRVKRTEDP